MSVWQTVNALEQEFRDRAAQQATSVNRSGVNVTPKPFTFGTGHTVTQPAQAKGDGSEGSGAAKGEDSRSLEGVSEAVSAFIYGGCYAIISSIALLCIYGKVVIYV